MTDTQDVLRRALSFADDYGLQVPIILAPMPGATPVPLSVAVTSGGGMGSCGVLLMTPDQIKSWVLDMRASSNGTFQLNTWIPDPDPIRDQQHETEVRNFLGNWGPACFGE
jgi:nitronate monooxygenase